MARNSHHAGLGPSQRQLRAGQVIRAALVEVLDRRETANPLLDNTPITVGEVRMSPDLKHATAFVSPFGNFTPVQKQNILDALNKHTPKIQGQIGKKVSLKFTPSLRFIDDTSYDEAQHMDRLLQAINKK